MSWGPGRETDNGPVHTCSYAAAGRQLDLQLSDGESEIGYRHALIQARSDGGLVETLRRLGDEGFVRTSQTPDGAPDAVVIARSGSWGVAVHLTGGSTLQARAVAAEAIRTLRGGVR